MNRLCYKFALLLLVIVDGSPTAKPTTAREADMEDMFSKAGTCEIVSKPKQVLLFNWWKFKQTKLIRESL